MAEPFFSTAGGGLRSNRSHHVDMPRDSLFFDSTWRSRDEERMRRLQAETDVRSCMERCSVFTVQCGNLFCFGKMPVLTRVLVLWFWILVLTTVVSLLTVNVGLGPVTYSLSPRDSLLVSAKISNFFCGSVSLQGASSDSIANPYTAYLLDSLPSVNYQRPNQYSIQRSSLFMGEKEKNHWKFYFLPGSKATATVCQNGGSVSVYVIKGQGNFQTWQSNPECDGCYISRTNAGACSSPRPNPSIDVEVQSTDDFFFAILNTGIFTEVRVTINVSRTVYDTSFAVRNCDTYTKDCRFPLNFGYTQYVVFVAGENWSQEGQLTSACQPRVWTFVDIFLLGTLVLGLTLSLIICCCSRDPRTSEMQIVEGRRGWWRYRRMGRDTLPSERSPLLGSPSSIPRTAAGPPRYDDVVPRWEGPSPPEPPPPYSPTGSGVATSAPPTSAATESGSGINNKNTEDDPHPGAKQGTCEGRDETSQCE